MRVRGVLPAGVRVITERVEADLRALGAALTQPRRPRSARRTKQRVVEVVVEVSRARPAEAPEMPVEPLEIRWSDGASFWALPGETILEAALRERVDLEFSCTLGGCGACMLELEEGQVAYDDPDGICLSAQEQAEGWCLACVGRPRGPLVLRR